MLIKLDTIPTEVPTIDNPRLKVWEIVNVFLDEHLNQEPEFTSLINSPELGRLTWAYILALTDLRLENPLEYVVYLATHHRDDIDILTEFTSLQVNANSKANLLLLLELVTGGTSFRKKLSGMVTAEEEKELARLKEILANHIDSNADTQPLKIRTRRLTETSLMNIVNTGETQMTEEVVVSDIGLGEKDIPYWIVNLQSDPQGLNLYIRACLETASKSRLTENFVFIINFLDTLRTLGNQMLTTRSIIYQALKAKEPIKLLGLDFFKNNPDLFIKLEALQMEFDVAEA